MITEVPSIPSDFCRNFLMARKVIDPEKYGIDQSRAEFIDDMNEAFASTYMGKLSVDELLLHPREALWFCDEIRRRYRYFDLPDDIVLRAIMDPRKHPPKKSRA